MRKIHFDEQSIKEIISLYATGKSCKVIGKQFGCSKQIINKVLTVNDTLFRDPSHSKRTYYINENIFESINTQEKAYWLGMLTGDGHISDRNEIVLSLEQEDKYLIYAFKEFLKSEHPIVSRINKGGKLKETNGIRKDGTLSISYSISITNKKINYDLRKYGFTSNKTTYLSFPDVPDEFLSSYFLGLVDSDGSFCRSGGSKMKALSFSFVAPTEFAEKFQNILIDICNISRTKLGTQDTEFIRIVEYGGYHNIFKIVKFLYSKSPIWMYRKKNLAINYLLTKFPEDAWLLENKNN